MKSAIVLFSLVCLAWGAPQLRKSFHDHFSDFMDIIIEEAGEEMKNLNDNYIEFEEFRASLDFMAGKDFNALVKEMEDLPEFITVVEFLEGHEIDITYFIEMFNSFIDSFDSNGKRLQVSGRDMSSYIQDTIALFPKEKLAALYESKIENDAEFKRAMESLQSDEFKDIWNALWENETFKVEVEALTDNGIEVGALLDEILAIFGQN